MDANAAERTLLNRENNVMSVYQLLSKMSPEDKTKLREWLLLNVVSMKFRIPKIDDDLAKLSTEDKSLEKIDRERSKIERDFAMYEDEFKRQFPGAKLGIDYTYRNTSAENDTTYNRWRPAGKMDIRQTVGEAPDIVKVVLDSVKQLSASKGFPVKSISEMANDSVIDSYYFCLLAVKLFDDDITFYKKADKPMQSSEQLTNSDAEPDNPFDLEFESFNAYGEKLHEGKDDRFVCCICGEECVGYGNNPEPYKHEGKCCDACNLHFVIPARMALIGEEE